MFKYASDRIEREILLCRARLVVLLAFWKHDPDYRPKWWRLRLTMEADEPHRFVFSVSDGRIKGLHRIEIFHEVSKPDLALHVINWFQQQADQYAGKSEEERLKLDLMSLQEMYVSNLKLIRYFCFQLLLMAWFIWVIYRAGKLHSVFIFPVAYWICALVYMIAIMTRTLRQSKQSINSWLQKHPQFEDKTRKP